VESREQIIARVMVEYDQHLAEWLATLTPEQLALREASKAIPFRPSRKISIERESRSAVLGSLLPYRY
jgi:hypothetical protein